MDRIQLHNGDCLEVMRKSITPNSVNMVITSPPYNVNLGQNKYKKEGYNSYDDNLPYDKYLSWMKDVFTECYNILCDDGRICINIGDGGNGSIPTHSDFIYILHKIGFLPLTTIVWNKNNTSNRCAWGSYLSAINPSFPRSFEYIIVFYKKSKKLIHKGISTVTKEEWIKYSNGLWVFPPELRQKYIGHPAMFPVELPTRLIKMLSYKDDVILDPFMGSGTAGVAAVLTDRKFIGIELDQKYFQVANKRISDAVVERNSRLF